MERGCRNRLRFPDHARQGAALADLGSEDKVRKVEQ